MSEYEASQEMHDMANAIAWFYEDIGGSAVAVDVHSRDRGVQSQTPGRSTSLV